MKIQAVVFDVDGTLYANSAMYRRSFLFALRHIRFINAFAEVRKELRRCESIDDFELLQARLLGERLNISTDEARRCIYQRVQEWEKRLAGITFIEGLFEFLEHLSSAGIKSGLLSDFPINRKLEIIGLSVDWNCTVSSEEVGCLKPRVEPFQAVSEELQLPPGSILYVGNSYRYDVEGAKNAGMLAAHIARKPEKNSIADVTVSNYFQLDTWLFDRLVDQQ